MALPYCTTHGQITCAWPKASSPRKPHSPEHFGDGQITTLSSTLFQQLTTQLVNNISFFIWFKLPAPAFVSIIAPPKVFLLVSKFAQQRVDPIAIFFSGKPGKQHCCLTICCHRICTGGRRPGRCRSTKCTWSWGSFQSL